MNSYIFLSIFLMNLISNIRSDDEVYHWDADIYPNLTSPLQAKFCTGFNRNPPSSVCDPDQLLLRNEAISLDDLIDKSHKRYNHTICICEKCPPHKPGLKIKVALVKFVKVMKNVSLDRSVEMFAERTRRRWRFGEDCSNDVLIFFSALDDRIFVSMGSRARRVLPEEDVLEILKSTKAHFTSGYYKQGLESIIATLQDESQNYEPKVSKMGFGMILLITACVLVTVITVIIIIYWFLIRKRRNSLSGSFEFIGSWGRNRNKNKTQVKPKIDPIYKPVKTSDKQSSDDSTLPMTAKEPIV